MSHCSRICRSRWIDICTSLAALIETQRESIVGEYIRLYLRHCIVLLIQPGYWAKMCPSRL